ncbi:hypothetical protein KM149_06945 [Staphylococcus coagulans]|uniref:hypothetical protein n=1 Tax=Staphylococcus coagulans TaxID=74706 RepID=UPI001F4BEFD9|nr:hypothetical protein [Staphylococcus coagulans]UNB47632.1 hypothetical protein KM149_06945 [Staphylococcus coagulans]
MNWNEFEKFFRKVTNEIDEQFDPNSEYFKNTVNELKSKSNGQFSDEYIYLLALHECSKKHNETLIYSVVHKFLKGE